MTAYTLVQCSICQRKKTIPTDNKRANIDLCTITKGCTGHLFKIGTTTQRMITPAVEGLQDWTAPGSVATAQTPSESEPAGLVTSSSGALTLALYQTAAVTTANPSIVVRFNQLKSENVSSQNYFFKVSSSTTIISGKDSSGRVLRFDSSAAAQGRVFIRVNGVARWPGQDLSLQPNTVIFNSSLSAGSSIDIAVYQEASTIVRDLTFTSNSTHTVSSDLGSWGNCAWLQERDSAGLIKPNHWWLYTCTQMSSIPSSAVLKLDKIYKEDAVTVLVDPVTQSTSRWLLASPPYASADRYLNFYADSAAMAADWITSFAVNSGKYELVAAAAALKEIYPPFQLAPGLVPTGSFTSADVFATSAALAVDTTAHRLHGIKILGPV